MARRSSHPPLSGHLASGHLSPQIISRLSAFDPADLGPHAHALWRDLCGAAAAGLPLAVVVLAVITTKMKRVVLVQLAFVLSLIRFKEIDNGTI